MDGIGLAERGEEEPEDDDIGEKLVAENTMK